MCKKRVLRDTLKKKLRDYLGIFPKFLVNLQKNWELRRPPPPPMLGKFPKYPVFFLRASLSMKGSPCDAYRLGNDVELPALERHLHQTVFVHILKCICLNFKTYLTTCWYFHICVDICLGRCHAGGLGETSSPDWTPFTTNPGPITRYITRYITS